VLREPLRVPETKPIGELLRDFQRAEVHMAIVVDEYGGTAGICTIEDVLEEIVGEIHDEHEPHDELPPVMDRVSGTRFEADGRVPIAEINERLGLSLPEDGDYDTIAGFLLEAGRAVVVGVNKWDLADEYRRDRLKLEIERKLGFLGFARTHYLTATEGKGVGALMRSVNEAYAAATAKLSTPRLTRALQEAVERQQPPRRGPIRPKMRYAHQGGQNPPVVVIHGNSLDRISDSYRRYLEGWFRDTFSLQGTPLRVEFRTSANPYAR
jgi:hypothetical protein